MKRAHLIQLRLAVHKSLTDNYVCQGMDREAASRAGRGRWGFGRSAFLRAARGHQRRSRAMDARPLPDGLRALLLRVHEFLEDEADNRSAAGSQMSDYEREPRDLADELHGWLEPGGR